MGVWLRVWGFGVWGLGLKDLGWRFRVNMEFWVHWGLGFGIRGFRFGLACCLLARGRASTAA